MILAIDPGNIRSAYVVIDENLKPREFGILANEDILEKFYLILPDNIRGFAVEMVASYGMPVGKEVFDTCRWIGRFEQKAATIELQTTLIYRLQVKNNICHKSNAKDSNIRQALIDRFGIVGTKKNPGWFYGFKADIWAAYAVAVTYCDLFRDVRAVG